MKAVKSVYSATAIGTPGFLLRVGAYVEFPLESFLWPSVGDFLLITEPGFTKRYAWTYRPALVEIIFKIAYLCLCSAEVNIHNAMVSYIVGK